MYKPVYLGLSILELSKILMSEFCYDYVKPNYGKKAKLCYMYTLCFNVYIKIDDIYKDFAEDFETRFDTSIYELDRPLLKGKNKKVIGLINDELGGKIMLKFVGLSAKGTKKRVIKRKLKFENYKNCLEATELENNINHLENLDSFLCYKRKNKEFIKSNKLVLTT